MAVDSYGYLYTFSIYTGRKGNEGKRVENLGPKVVMQLAEEYVSGVPFVFVADNFFSSVKLVQDLEGKGLYYIGTIRNNRM
jgi:hypothetical protein